MSLFDNVAFPLREHTKKSRGRDPADRAGEDGDGRSDRGRDGSCPARSPAACASAPVWPGRWCSTRRSSCATSPTPVWIRSVPRTSPSCSIDINAQIDATILIVTHNINIARTVPDNIGMLFRRELVMFGPREVLLTSEEPVGRAVPQRPAARPDRHVRGEGRRPRWPREQAAVDAGHNDGCVRGGRQRDRAAAAAHAGSARTGRRAPPQGPRDADPAHAAAARAAGDRRVAVPGRTRALPRRPGDRAATECRRAHRDRSHCGATRPSPTPQRYEPPTGFRGQLPE